MYTIFIVYNTSCSEWWALKTLISLLQDTKSKVHNNSNIVHENADIFFWKKLDFKKVGFYSFLTIVYYACISVCCILSFNICMWHVNLLKWTYTQMSNTKIISFYTVIRHIFIFLNNPENSVHMSQTFCKYTLTKA